MKVFLILLITLLLAIGCDCMQRADGIVLDSETRKPLDSVAFGKDIGNPFKYRDYSDEQGYFEYSGVGGGFLQCEDLCLDFDKSGYTMVTKIFSSDSHNDTIYLKRLK